MKKIILIIEIFICIVAVIFAFFYGAIYSKSIQKNIPFFFGAEEEISDMMGVGAEIENGELEKGSIEDEINDFFKDDEIIGDDLDTLIPEGEEVVQPEGGEVVPVVPPVSADEVTTPADSTISPETEVIQETPETSGIMDTSEQPILIPEEQIKQDDVGEIQQIQETDLAIPSDAEEVQVEIGDEPVKIEGVQGIESEEIDLEDLEEMQNELKQQEIDVDSDLIEL
jgi:hypothetical protein